MRHVRVRRSSCIHAMDASDTPRIFNPTPDVACISKQSGTLRALSRFLSHSPVPLFFFPFHFCQLFLFPPIEAACHWTWLGDLVASFVNGIFSVAFFVAKGEQVKWDSRLRYWTFLVTFIGRRMNGPANWIDW